MSDDSELQARIAAVAGQINYHKQKQSAPPFPSHFSRPSYRPRGAAHWTPFGGRGGRAGFAGVHKNRTLVVGSTLDTAPAPVDDNVIVKSAGTSGTSTPVHNGLVSTRGGRNHQLMNKQTFDRERKQKLERLEKQRAMMEQKRPAQKLPTPPPAKSSAKPARMLDVEGIKFEMQEDGSKLIRIHDSATAELDTPKKYSVAGVDFFRSKKGNLVRAIMRDGRAVKPTPKAQCENFTKHGTYPTHHCYTGYASAKTTEDPNRARQAGKVPSHVLTSSTGKCPFGPSCKFAHNPDKVAICKDFLHKSCPAGANCDLSHDPTYERVPACTHFLRGNCTKTACLYPHINVSFDAPVCRPFATLGFCAKGGKCGDRHVFECPDYANSGHCAKIEKGKCPLQHVDRAGNLRKVAQRQSKVTSPDESDISSDDEEAAAGGDAIDIDSDDESVDIMMGLDDDSHELSQQRDFIAFS